MAGGAIERHRCARGRQSSPLHDRGGRRARDCRRSVPLGALGPVDGTRSTPFAPCNSRATSSMSKPAPCSDGHLAIPKGAIGVEAFVHNGHEYTYFGPFPSLIRMPILALTHAYDARLTAPSMLVAWILTAAFCSLLVWRVRVMMRGAMPARLAGGHLLWRARGRRHKWLGAGVPRRNAVVLPRGPRVERCAHDRRNVRVARSPRAAVRRAGHRQRCPHPRRQPDALDHRLVVCDRGNPDRRLVPNGAWR